MKIKQKSHVKSEPPSLDHYFGKSGHTKLLITEYDEHLDPEHKLEKTVTLAIVGRIILATKIRS